MVKPNVIVPGCPKCGTMYLLRLLRQHPDIYALSGIYSKNPLSRSFFQKRELKRYFSYFKPKNKEKIIMNFCRFTSLNLNSAYKIKKVLPNLKIIFVIRNKKEQRLSIYHYLMNAGFLANVSFEEYKKRYHYYVKYSNYKEMIKPYKKLFDVMVLKIDNINKKDLRKLTNFLGIKNYNFDLSEDKNTTPDFVKKEGYNKIKRIRRIIFFISCYLGTEYYWENFKEKMGYADSPVKYNKNRLFGYLINLYLKIKLSGKQRKYYDKTIVGDDGLTLI